MGCSSVAIFLAVLFLSRRNLVVDLSDHFEMLPIALHCTPIHHLADVQLFLLAAYHLQQLPFRRQQITTLFQQKLDVPVGQSQDKTVSNALYLPHEDRLSWNCGLNSVKHVEPPLFAHQQILEIALPRLLLEVAAQRKQIELSVISLLQHPHIPLHDAAALVGHPEVKSLL